MQSTRKLIFRCSSNNKPGAHKPGIRLHMLTGRSTKMLMSTISRANSRQNTMGNSLRTAGWTARPTSPQHKAQSQKRANATHLFRPQNCKIISQLRSKSTSKIYPNCKEAIKDIHDGATLLFGGFGLCGIPENLIQSLVGGPKNLTVVSDNCGIDHFGLGQLLYTHQIKHVISSFIGENHEFERQYLSGDLEVELTPQGTLAEKIRSGGAGIPAFFTPTGANTDLVDHGGFPVKMGPNGFNSKPREARMFNGRKCVMEESIFGDFALVKAWKADTLGNLVYRKTARNFNPLVATAAKITIAEVEEIVEVGELDPDQIHTPSIYVQRIVKPPSFKKPIEHLTLEEDSRNEDHHLSETMEKKIKIARRAAHEFRDGMYCNLGIGVPTLAANYIDPTITIHLQSENGLLGMGPFPKSGFQDADLINAGKQTITMLPGAVAFDSATSFGMIRGGHVNLTMLGGLQVSQKGDLANWVVPGKMVKGPGGAMDLVACGSKVVVLMQHVAKGNELKLLKECSLPLTGTRCVDRLITDLAVFDFPKNSDRAVLVEVASESNPDEVRALTGFDYDISPNLSSF